MFLPLAGAGFLPAAISFSMPVLFLTFLKIGSVLYGGGYVLLAFLRADFVERLGWLTDQQLIDAVAIGQVTPGPLFGCDVHRVLLGGLPGGLLRRGYLPSHLSLFQIRYPVRSSPGWVAGRNARALGLMAAVTVQLEGGSRMGRSLIRLVCLALLFRFV
jgi:chromate transporter